MRKAGIPDAAESMSSTRVEDEDDKQRRVVGKKIVRERERLNERLSTGFAMLSDGEEHEEITIDEDGDDWDDA